MSICFPLCPFYNGRGRQRLRVRALVQDGWVGLTILPWFALVKTYSASKLSAFTLITPLFGVVAAYFIMKDQLTLAFGAAALLVVAGLYLVNKPDPKLVPDPNMPV
jgi:hypothetical protein